MIAEMDSLRLSTLPLLVLALVAAAAAALPEYVPTCARSDPALDNCILRAVEELRPRLLEGIPELEVPSLKELKINEMVLSPAEFSSRVLARNIVARGADQFRVFRFKSDLEHNTFYVGVELPVVDFNAQYSLNIPTPVMRVNGAGDVRGNVTNLRCNAVLEGKVTKRDGKSYFNFKTLDLDVKISDYKVFFNGLFGDNKVLEDIVLRVANERSREFAWGIEPFAERAASTYLLALANRIAKNLPIEDIFPQPSP